MFMVFSDPSGIGAIFLFVCLNFLKMHGLLLGPETLNQLFYYLVNGYRLTDDLTWVAPLLG
jgi:hypothetical protein